MFSPIIVAASCSILALSFSLISLSSALSISSQTLASAPSSIACKSASVKMFSAANNSSFELLSVTSLIGASGVTSASFSILLLVSLVPITGIIATFFCPHSLTQNVSFFPSSVAVASLITVHSPDQSCPSGSTFTSANVVVVVPFSSTYKLPHSVHS